MVYRRGAKRQGEMVAGLVNGERPAKIDRIRRGRRAGIGSVVMPRTHKASTNHHPRAMGGEAARNFLLSRAFFSISRTCTVHMCLASSSGHDLHTV